MTDYRFGVGDEEYAVDSSGRGRAGVIVNFYDADPAAGGSIVTQKTTGVGGFWPEFTDTHGTLWAMVSGATDARAIASPDYLAEVAGVGTTNDTIIAGRINDSASATHGALTAAYVGRASASEIVRYVSTYGNDANDGRDTGKPFATIAAAAASLPAKAGRIVVLPGAAGYQLAGTQTLDAYTDLTIEGAGSKNQVLMVVNGNYDGLAITGISSRITLKNLWIGSFAARASGVALRIVGTSGTFSDQITLEDVTLQDTHDGLYVQYLGGLHVNRLSVLNSISGAMAGNGVRLLATQGAQFRDSTVFSYTGTIGLDGFLIDSDCDTIVCDGVGVTAANNGFVLANNLGGSSTGPRLSRLTNCYSESNASVGFSISAGRDIRMAGCHSAVNGGVGYGIGGGDSINLTDFLALSNGLHGVSLEGGTGVKIAEGTASNNGTSAANTYYGINVQSVNHARIVNNRTGDFIFPGSPSQAYGIILGGTSDYLVVQGNDTADNSTGGLGNFASGTNSSVVNNI